MIEIKHNGKTILEPVLLDGSYRRKSIDNQDEIVLKFETNKHIDIPIGSIVEWRGSTYTLETPEALKMEHSEHFSYTATFSAPSVRIEKYKVLNMVDGRVDFPLTATPKEHLQLIVDNLNKRENGWSIGDCIEDSEKLITYDHTDCRTALQAIADEFKTELHIEGKVISLATLEKDKSNPLELQYGEGKGFLGGIGKTHDAKSGARVVFVKTSDRNIDFKTYGSKSLRLPKGTTIEHKGQQFKTDKDGSSVRFSDAPNDSREDVLDLTNIYPSRVGTVTEVIEVPTTTEDDEETTFYDFTDTSIPDDLDFDKEVIEGEALTIIFQSGMLTGREFEVKYVAEEKDGKKGKRFEIIQKDEDGVIMPGGAFVPKSGDKYAVFHCQLPQSYIDTAEKELLKKACEFLIEQSKPRYTFTGEIDGIWAKKKWSEIAHRLEVGRFVSFTDERFQPTPILVRIVGITEYLNNPYSPKIELSNAPVSVGVFSEIKQEIREEKAKRRQQGDAIKQLEEKTYKDTETIREMIENINLDGFSETTNPLTLQTMMAVIGSPELQFDFVASPKILEATPFVFEWRKGDTEIYIPTQHLRKSKESNTLTTKRKSVVYTIPKLTYSFKDKQKQLYLYAQTASQKRFVLSEEPLPKSEDNNLIGLVYGDNGGRKITQLYGFTEVTPGQIKTDLIRSQDGKSFWDLLSGRFQTKSDFIIGNPDSSSGEPCLAFIDGKLFLRGMFITIGDEDTSIEEALLARDEAIKKERQEREKSEAEYKRKLEKSREELQKTIDDLKNSSEQDNADLIALIQKVNDALDNLQSQVDGEVSNWFYSGSPSPSKEPEKNWINNQMKVAHVGDTYTSTDESGEYMGKSWRYMPSFTWQEIHDTLVSKALHLASKAQSTADGKSTTYLTKPTSYTKGDAWKLEQDYTLNGKDYKEGTILYATQSSPSFVSAHWVESRYIGLDDFEVGTRNLIIGALSKKRIQTYAGSSVWGEYDDGEIRRFQASTGDKTTTLKAYWHPDVVEKKEGTKYTASVFVKNNRTDNTPIFVFFNGFREEKKIEVNPSGEWKEVLFTGVANTSPFQIQFHSLTPDYYLPAEFKHPMLVRGDKKADFTPAPEDVQEQIDELNTSITEASKATSDLNEYVNGAFRDGLISDTEAVAIEKLINLVNSQKAGLEATYNKLYANSYLKGTAKSSLLNAKVSYFGAVENVLNSINTAIGDGKATKTEKQEVDRKFSAYNVALADFQNAVELANRAIQIEIERIAKGYTDDKVKKTIVSTDVEYYSSTSRTDLSGGKWQTIAPEWGEGRYIWSRTKIVLYDGATSYSPSEKGVCIAGATGKDGKDGKNGTRIVSITEEFYLSDSKTELIGGSWTTTPPKWEYGKYIWTRSRIKYENPTSEETTTPLVSSEWEAVNEIEIGTRNYILHSKLMPFNIEYKDDKRGRAYTQRHGVYDLTERGVFKENTQYTLWYEQGEIENTANFRPLIKYTDGTDSVDIFPSQLPFVTDKNKTVDYVYNYYGYGGTFEYVNLTFVEGNKPMKAWLLAPEDIQQQIDEEAKHVKELQEGLGNASTLIKSLETITKELKEGKLNAEDFKNVEYLIDALKNGDSYKKGGLLLTRVILMSNSDNKITTAISGYNEGGGVAFEAGIKNYKQENHTSRVVINHDGSARFGDMYVNTEEEDVVKFIGKDSDGQPHEYIKLGGTAPTEAYMNEENTVIKEFSIPSVTRSDSSGSVMMDRWKSIESNREVVYNTDITATAIAMAEMSPYHQGGGAYYPPSYASCTAYIEVVVKPTLNGSQVWKGTSPSVTVNAKAVGGSFSQDETPDPNALIDKKTNTIHVTVKVPSNVIEKGCYCEAALVVNGTRESGTPSSFTGSTSNTTQLLPYDKSKSFLAVAKDKVAFFFGRQRQILLNYASDWLLKIIGNVLVQGTLKADRIEADEVNTTGSVLAGAMFDEDGKEQKGFGKYKNRRNYGTAYAGYSYSTNRFTVYHSIPHRNYIPIVQVTGDYDGNSSWSLAPRVFNVTAFSFEVLLISNSDNGKKNGFSYIAYKGD